MKKYYLLCVMTFTAISSIFAQKQYTLTSPDENLQTNVYVGEKIEYQIQNKGKILLENSPIALTLVNGNTWGEQPKVIKANHYEKKGNIVSPFYRADSITENYKSLVLRFKGDFSIEFRAYNDGIAYRFINHSKQPFCIKNETVEYHFPDNYQVTVPYVRENEGNIEAQFFNSFENVYETTSLTGYNPKRLSFLPLLVDTGTGVKMCITETNLENYPGLYMNISQIHPHTMVGVFARYPKYVKQGGHNNLQLLVTEREQYIAEVNGARTFPWRIIAIAQKDTDLAASDLSFLLAEPSRISDISWIKPGKVAWEWWNALNLADVEFRAWKNTDTYKYYIDFAASKNIEYIILDEGWAENGKANLMCVVPEIDLKALIDYAATKKVGIILWAGYYAFHRDMEQVCKYYSKLGVKGFKVDFMDRDDQKMTAFNYQAAQVTAKYKLLLDLHGTHKPARLNRTYPNVLNFEGVHGLEQMKWNDISKDQMKYDVTIPFIRQLAGPMDYTQGAMLNATKKDFYPCYFKPMSQGTRCHQLALYMILDSPLNMLCDSPTHYNKEIECTEFIASIPTVWNETRIIDGEVGEWIITARRNNSIWYVGGITNWTSRDVKLDLSFLPQGKYKIEIFKDGINADRNATDYKKDFFVTEDITKIHKLHLAPGGGFAMKIEGYLP